MYRSEDELGLRCSADNGRSLDPLTIVRAQVVERLQGMLEQVIGIRFIAANRLNATLNKWMQVA